MKSSTSSNQYPNNSVESGNDNPTFEDAINHNDINVKEKESTDTIETLDIAERDKNTGSDNNGEQQKRGFSTKLSDYDPRKTGCWMDLDGDKKHVLVLFFLYILQGIPLGMGTAIPLLLQEREVGYDEQAKFSIASYPFSMKILWAPIVDSIFIKSFGRRKSWLIPTQMLIGITMLVLSQYVEVMLGSPPEDKCGNSTLWDNTTETTETSTKLTVLVTNSTNSTTNETGPSSGSNNSITNVAALTASFFFLKFLAATQDVAVDGWALTMLKPKNVGYASTCNAIGQQTGWCLGYIVYTILDDNCLINLSQFLLFWGIVFIVTTLLIAIFKKEKNQQLSMPKEGDEENEQEPDLGIVETYKVIWKIICHPLFPPIFLFLFTFAIGFSASDTITNLKLVDAGVPKGKIAEVSIWMIPVKVAMTLIVTRFTVGPRPMNVWLYCYPGRIIIAIAAMLLVYVTPMFKLEGCNSDLEDCFPEKYYILMIFIAAFQRAMVYGQFVAIMAFFARISDPVVGGTNMTFFNTLANLGNMWTLSFFLWFVKVITYKDCNAPEVTASLPTPTINQNVTFGDNSIFEDNFCYDNDQKKECKDAGGHCDITTDGYYILCISSAVFGVVWFVWAWRTIRRLQQIDVMEWRVTRSKSVSPRVILDGAIKKITGLRR